jgi:hypothetical protein
MTVPINGNRIKLVADTNFYVDVVGNNNNNGVTLGTAKADIQSMYDELKWNYDLGGFLATINLTPGASGDEPNVYPTQISLSGMLVGAGDFPGLKIVGDLAHPERVVIQVTGDALLMYGAWLDLGGVKIGTDDDSGGSSFQIHAQSYLTHHDCWISSADHEIFECNDSTIEAVGDTIVSGHGEDFCHFTTGGQILWGDHTITLIDEATGLPGTRVTGPKYVNYIAGGNRGSSTFERAVLVGSFGCDEDHLSRLFIHIGATLNLSSCTNIEALFPGQSPPQVESGGRIVYSDDVGGTIYCRQDAIGNNGNGYGDNEVLAFLLASSAIDYLAKRPPDQIFPPIPIIKCGPGTWPAFRPKDIPGVAEVILLGDEENPSNCIISTTEAYCIDCLNTQTKWHIRGFKFVSTAGGAMSLPPGGTKIAYQNCDFSDCFQFHIQVGMGSYVEDTGPWTISGDAAGLITIDGAGARITNDVTVVGTPAYTDAGVRASGATSLTITSQITGVTGTRCAIQEGAIVRHNGDGSQTGLPGSTDGIVDSGSFGLLI